MPTVPNEPREDLLARISRRRNAVEFRLRELLRTGLRFSLGKKAGDGLLSSLATDRRAVVAQYSYDDTWEQLYFDELRGILDKHWPAFQNLFGEEKTKVLQWLEHVNRCRADAHARTLSDDDLAYLNVCFRRLEEALDSVVK